MHAPGTVCRTCCVVRAGSVSSHQRAGPFTAAVATLFGIGPRPEFQTLNPAVVTVRPGWPMLKAHTKADDPSQRNLLLKSTRKKQERERQKTKAGQWRRGGVPAGRTTCSAAQRSGADGRTTGDPAAAAFCTQLPRRHSQHRDAAAAMHNRGRPNNGVAQHATSPQP